MSINVGYFATESFQNFRRNWVMSLGAVITIYLSLLLVGVFLVTGVLVNSVVRVRRGQGHHPDLPQGRRRDRGRQRAADSQLLADPLVEGVDYTSKEEALEQVQAGHGAAAPRSSSSSRATRCRPRST